MFDGFINLAMINIKREILIKIDNSQILKTFASEKHISITKVTINILHSIYINILFIIIYLFI